MSEIKFSCPRCRQHIACDDSYAGIGIDCPACGGAMRVPVSSRQASRTAAAVKPAAIADITDFTDSFELTIKPYWLLFWLVLLAPMVLSLIALATFSAGEVWLNVVCWGSGLAGIVCAYMLARVMGESVAVKTVLFIICAPVLSFLALGFCAVGCTAAGLVAMSKH